MVFYRKRSRNVVRRFRKRARRRIVSGSKYRRRRPYSRKAQLAKCFKLTQKVPAGMPIARFATLRYVTSITQNLTLGSMNTLQYALNNLYDPEVAVGGHQPRGFDQWSAIFQKYLVYGCKITVTLTTPAAATDALAWGMYPSDMGATPLSSPTGIMEQKLGPWRQTDNQRKISSCKMYWSAKKWFNVKNLRDQADNYGAYCTTSPINAPTVQLWARMYDSASPNAVVVAFTVLIDYFCMFSDPQQLPQS